MRSKVLETRTGDFGLVMRRRLREDGLRFTTVEIPIEVWSTFFKSTSRHGGKNRMQGWLNRRANTAKKVQAAKYFNLGWKLEAVANELKTSVRTVCDWRKQWRAEHGKV